MRTEMKKLVILLAIIFALAAPASASIILDTGQTANSVEGEYTAGWVFNTNQWFAAEFSVDSAYTITDIQGLMYINSGGEFNITLYSEVPNTDYYANLHLNKLFSSSVSAQQDYEKWIGAAGLDWAVSTGSYWVALETEDTGFEGGMPWGAPNSIGEEDYTWDGKWWNPEEWGYDRLDLGIRIWGDEIVSVEDIYPSGGSSPSGSNSVPEPATMLLLGSGFLGLGICGRKRFKK